MANLTKIILGLNILAGGAGIFFGITKSGQASELVEKAKTAETKATAAVGKMTKLEDEQKKLVGDLSIKTQEAASSKIELDTATRKANSTGGKLTDLQTEYSNLKTTNQVLTTERDNLQAKADEVVLAQAALSTATNLIQTLRTQLDNLKAPKKPKGPQKSTVGTNVRAGNIVQQNPNTGSIILNIGTVHGIKVEDQFDVFRNNKHIGRIKVSLLGSNPNLSIAQRTEALGVPKDAQFKTGDELFRFQPK